MEACVRVVSFDRVGSSMTTRALTPRAAAAVLIVAMLSAAAGTAAADAPERPVPNYDGREDPPTTVGDVAIWVPRLVLSPLWVVSEYGVRRPLGFLVANVEEHHVPHLLYEFFTFDHGQAGLV